MYSSSLHRQLLCAYHIPPIQSSGLAGGEPRGRVPEAYLSFFAFPLYIPTDLTREL